MIEELVYELPQPPGPRPGISMTESSWLYEMLFMFLQISPSYRLANRVDRGKQLALREQLPADFDVVQSVYRDLGNVFYKDFDDWWYGKAQHKFGHDNALGVTMLGAVPQGRTVGPFETAEIAEKVRSYLSVERDEASMPAVALVGIPLYADKELCKQALSMLIDDLYGDQSKHEPGMPYLIAKNRRKHRDMIKLLQLVWLRAGLKNTNRHATAGHRVMSRLGLTKLNRTMPAKPGSRESVEQATQKTNAAIAMQTRLREAYRIAENAARGVFPSEAPLADERTWDIFIGKDLHRLIRYDNRYSIWREREYMRKAYPGLVYRRGDMESISIEEAEDIVRQIEASKNK